MPRNVRNFWIEGEIDGRKSPINGGPKPKDGGFSLTIKQRSKGEVVQVLTINGIAREDGTLSLALAPFFRDSDGNAMQGMDGATPVLRVDEEGQGFVIETSR